MDREMTTRRHKRSRRAGPGDAEEVAKQRPSTAGGAKLHKPDATDQECRIMDAREGLNKDQIEGSSTLKRELMCVQTA
ncbi:hypothetical protein BLNAU_18928 [Blattamonas nauphoetae]|uniref:Transposase n=1 Tax=Blattamonas nauphoetae TaxID=2049346 RepID=A0ABQ9X680_9EUKA|nr:hypothetical protein BLNAU_18928 [Blattamonas nauphoetae]